VVELAGIEPASSTHLRLLVERIAHTIISLLADESLGDWWLLAALAGREPTTLNQHLL